MEKVMPWIERWKPVGQCRDGGGQGTTQRVRSEPDDVDGALKVLNHDYDKQARKRMRVEVDALKLLSEKGAAVPRILDSNVDKADDLDIALYFVMEWIDGQTLDDFVRHRKCLALEESVDIVAQIAKVVAFGHGEGLGHRDLKPKNVMVRLIEDDSKSVTVLDYGLSFNSASQDDLTRLNENIWNEFLSLPETNVEGGVRRDLRIDVAHMCGLFFFCLTGKYPQLLRDEQNRPPHGRDGVIFNGVDNKSDTYHLLDALFTRGFHQRANDRFQSVEELLASLALVQQSFDPRELSISEIAMRESERLTRHDRKTQLALIAPRMPKLYDQLVRAICEVYKGEKTGHFKIKERSQNLQTADHPQTAKLEHRNESNYVWTLIVPQHQYIREITYSLGLLGDELQVFRWLRNVNPGGWNPPDLLSTYPVDDNPAFAEVVHDFKVWLRRSIQELSNEIIPAAAEPVVQH